jgi:hypothetical protein
VSPARKIRVDTLAIADQWREKTNVLALEFTQNARRDRFLALRFDRYFAIGAVLCAQFYEQQTQEMMNLGERADGTFSAAAAGTLLDGNRRRDAVNGIHIRARCDLHKLARVSIERFEVAALPFTKDDVERQRGFAAARYAGNHGELLARQSHIEILQIVLACIANPDELVQLAFGPLRTQLRRRLQQLLQLMAVFEQRAPGVRARMFLDRLRCACKHHLPTGFTAFRAEVDDPVSSGDDIEIVLDDHQ